MSSPVRIATSRSQFKIQRKLFHNDGSLAVNADASFVLEAEHSNFRDSSSKWITLLTLVRTLSKLGNVGKPTLRVTKWLSMTPAVAICTGCSTEFKVPLSSLSRTKDAQEHLQKQFDEHKCAHQSDAMDLK